MHCTVTEILVPWWPSLPTSARFPPWEPHNFLGSGELPNKLTPKIAGWLWLSPYSRSRLAHRRKAWLGWWTLLFPSISIRESKTVWN